MTLESDALDVPAALWHRRWLILLLTVVAALGALTASLLQPKAYTSSADVWVKPTAINPPGSVPLAASIDLITEGALVRSQPVADAAAEETDGSADAMLSSVSVDTPQESQVMTIAFTASTPDAARDGAQAFADSYLAYRTEQATTQISEAIATAQEQITGLQTEVAALSKALTAADPGSQAAIQIQNQLTQANGQIAIWQNSASILNVSAVDAGSVIVPARAPSAPSAPDPLSDLARGALAGLAIGVVAALLAESARRAKERG